MSTLCVKKYVQKTACYKTTHHQQVTNHWKPTTDPPTGPPPIHQLPTTNHRQVFHQPTNHQPLTQRQVLHWPTDHQLTDSPTLLQLTNNPCTHQFHFNRVTIGPILSITNFNSSLGMGTTCYWIRKTIYKMLEKKDRW